ncbi:MAG: response regulator [Spirochaetaceae bacterium]|jgi:putative two-component system response regulator|nr:response regulator [Spirochaetaceae bacterium]
MKKILVVDDTIASLKQIGALLEGEYDVTLAKSGPMALTICARERPDLILLDVDMPGMDGFETLARLRMNPFLGSIPVIFLTGNRDADTEVKALMSGARDFITKPVEKSILAHRIELHLFFGAYERQLEDTVKELSDSIAVTFAEVIECRDENTGGHVVRTSKYVRMLGEDLLRRRVFGDELSQEELDLIVRAAPLHDIGKIAISDRILLKQERLSDMEFETMKTHAALGARIIEGMIACTSTLQYLKYAKVIANFHHERWDGKGYPQGLSGDAIPLAARLMSVADVYDALVDTRVYRKGMPHVEARAIIVDGSGKSFDPRVVESFIRIEGELEKASKNRL